MFVLEPFICLAMVGVWIGFRLQAINADILGAVNVPLVTALGNMLGSWLFGFVAVSACLVLIWANWIRRPTESN